MPDDKKLPSQAKKGKSLAQLKTEASQKMGASALTGEGFDTAQEAVKKVRKRKSANNKLKKVSQNLKKEMMSSKVF